MSTRGHHGLLLASGDTDPYWSNVVSLLHMDSAWPDATGRVWTPFSSPSISTATKKFGTGSGFFNNGPRIEAPTSSDWAFGTGDFTAECWLSATSMPTGTFFCPMGNWVSNIGGCFFLRPSGVITWRSDALAATSATGVISVNTWHHVAYSRSAGTGRVFVDGAIVATISDSANMTSTNGWTIGRNRVSGDNWRGYVDEVRITKGVARYTSAFTPPNDAFPNG